MQKSFYQGDSSDSEDDNRDSAIIAASYGTAIGAKHVDIAKNKVVPSIETGGRKASKSLKN